MSYLEALSPVNQQWWAERMAEMCSEVSVGEAIAQAVAHAVSDGHQVMVLVEPEGAKAFCDTLAACLDSCEPFVPAEQICERISVITVRPGHA